MNKKKAIKVLGASAIAASAFVATTPSGADAASAKDVQSLVKAAKDAGTVLKWAISTEGSADGTTRPWAQYNAAKAARDKAVAAINTLPAAQKAGYLADIEQNVNLHINRTMSYIDAITAGEKINVKKAALEAQIAKNLIDDNTEAAYHALSTEIRKQAILLDRVYGQSTRDEIRDNYKKSAETVRDSVKYEVSAKIELDLAKKAIAANDTATADKYLAEAAKYMKDVKNEVMKSALAKTVSELEAQMTPAVKSVSAINAKQVLVSFNKEVAEVSAETITNYQLQGIDLTSGDTVTLQKDKKSVMIDLNTALINGKSYSLKVKKDVIKDANDATKTVAEFTQTIFFNDTVKPTVSGIETLENGSLKVNFSEKITTGTTPNVVINGTAVASGNISVDTSGEFAIVNPTGLSLEKGKSYQIIVTGAKDIATPANVMDLYNGTFTYSLVNEAPVVKSVTTKGETTIVVEFSENLDAALVNNTTLKISKNGTPVTVTTSDIVAVNGTNKFEIKVPQTVFATGENSADLSVTLDGYKDAQGNVGEKVVKNVTLQKDTVAPKVKDSNFDAANDKLTVNFNETLAAVTAANYAPKMYVTDSNGVRYDVKTTGTSNKEVLTIADLVAGSESLQLNTSELANGTYTLTILSNAFTDEAIAQNGNALMNVSFTVSDSVSTAKPVISGVTVTKGQIVIAFDKAVKGGTVVGSATNHASYSINGQTIPSNSAIYLDTTQQQVTIQLPAGSVDQSGVKLLTVKDVQGTNGVTMDEATSTQSFTDDKAPTLDSARIDSTTGDLVVKFSEGLALAPVAGTDLELAINGTVITGYIATPVANKAGEFSITAPAGYNFATGTITVKVKDTATATDAATNAIVKDTTVTATR